MATKKKTKKQLDKQARKAQKAKAKAKKTLPSKPRTEDVKPRKAVLDAKKLTFKEKWSAISSSGELMCLPSSGYSKKGDYFYDKASEVFPIFNALFAKYRVLPPRLIHQDRKIVSFGNHPAYELECQYAIEDIDSDEIRIIKASGLGFDQVWSLDVVHTMVLKRALKDAFLASRPVYEEGKDSDEMFELPESVQQMHEQGRTFQQEMDEYLKEHNIRESLPASSDPETTSKTDTDQGQETAAPILPLEGMTKPGKLQEEKIQMILHALKGPYMLAGHENKFPEQEARNRIWLELNRWPKTVKEADAIIALGIELE